MWKNIISSSPIKAVHHLFNKYNKTPKLKAMIFEIRKTLIEEKDEQKKKKIWLKFEEIFEDINQWILIVGLNIMKC